MMPVTASSAGTHTLPSSMQCDHILQERQSCVGTQFHSHIPFKPYYLQF